MKMRNLIFEEKYIIPGQREGGLEITVEKMANGINIIQKTDSGIQKIFLTNTQISSLRRLK